MIEQLENNSLIYGYNKVSFVLIEVGNIACIETESLMFCLDIVSRGTLAENATFAVQNKRANAWCFICEKNVEINDDHNTCPTCDTTKIHIDNSATILIKKIEVE